MLRQKRLRLVSRSFRDVYRLLRASFPATEILPFWRLRLNTIRSSVLLLAFYEEETFVGFVYLVNCDDGMYMPYLAVSDTCRSQGFGRKMMTQVKMIACEKPVVAIVEEPDEDACNSEQRRRRNAFFRRNGMRDTGIRTIEPDGLHCVISTDPDLAPDRVRRLILLLSGGLYRPTFACQDSDWTLHPEEMHASGRR